MRDGRSPIIIDNTNIQAWEMKPYVRMVSVVLFVCVCAPHRRRSSGENNLIFWKQALERGYRVDFCEPDTAWKFDPCELERYDWPGSKNVTMLNLMNTILMLWLLIMVYAW